MGPRRTTLTFSSDDAPAQPSGDRQIHVYYCKYSGKHALTTDCDLGGAPRRRTDSSRVIDTEKFTVRLYTTDGGVKVLQRRDGRFEKQYRQLVGKLPVAYRAQPEARFLYIFDGALTAYSPEDREGGGAAPVPPCILAVGQNTTQVALDIDDRSNQLKLVKISADYVRVQMSISIASDGAGEELLEFFRALLGMRMADLSLKRGEGTRQKLLLLRGISPAAVFDKMQAAL
ncbi:hypothetical protein WJX73_003528 [Symbiochloris irregularis]|uniref:STEEP1 domain-containing protein n=1 Tax=Symbiochloris irregularis TaxID=706552 RepID=A0AAW1NTS3_9CHLO